MDNQLTLNQYALDAWTLAANRILKAGDWEMNDFLDTLVDAIENPIDEQEEAASKLIMQKDRMTRQISGLSTEDFIRSQMMGMLMMGTSPLTYIPSANFWGAVGTLLADYLASEPVQHYLGEREAAAVMVYYEGSNPVDEWTLLAQVTARVQESIVPVMTHAVARLPMTTSMVVNLLAYVCLTIAKDQERSERFNSLFQAWGDMALEMLDEVGWADASTVEWISGEDFINSIGDALSGNDETDSL